MTWLGSTAGQVVSWSDTQVVATVAPTALTGVARVQQNGVWSNAVGFTVPAPDGNGMTIQPAMLNMVVGDTHRIQALSSAGQSVTGLTWTSSDPTVVSLSSDDPPILTALAAGHVTITAGTASADVTVSAGALPLGTVLWSVPASDVYSIVPAVPSSTGVADVFAFLNVGSTVEAITSDGTIAWTAETPGAIALPDFQGGLVVWTNVNQEPPYYIVKLDGVTGRAVSTYTIDQQMVGTPGMAVHPDGTIFAVYCVVSEDQTLPNPCSVIGIDSATGAQKFSVALPGDVQLSNGPPIMIAGDGYAYVLYVARQYDPETDQVMLLRVNSSGAYDNIEIQGYTDARAYAGTLFNNADTGVWVTWTVEYPPDIVTEPPTLGPVVNFMAVTTGTGFSVANTPPLLPYPILQAQDGSFVGIWESSTVPSSMAAFDLSGGIRWIVPNYYPLMATADGGVIATSDWVSATVFDQNGAAIAQMANMPTQSWTGNEYTSLGSVDSISMPPVFPDGADFWAEGGGNPSGNETAFAQCPCLLQSAGAAPVSPDVRGAGPVAANRTAPLPRLSGAPLKTYVILEGDPGLNLPGHVPHNVGDLFNLAAGTQQDALNAQGNLAASPQRVSSVQDFAAQLTGNGLITGGVIYFGHGMGVDYGDGTQGSALAPGEQAGPDTNVTANNVNKLSNQQLDTGATITLHACFAGFGSGRYSIAQLIANQLQRRVYAPTAGTFFSVDPNSTASGATAPPLPDQVTKPIYQLQDFGVPFSTFLPAGL